MEHTLIKFMCIWPKISQSATKAGAGEIPRVHILCQGEFCRGAKACFQGLCGMFGKAEYGLEMVPYGPAEILSL